MRWLERIAFSPIAAVRPYLALKGTLLFLAFDLWLTRASHAGRYGAGGFNVAHFGWLERVQPTITPAVHLTVLFVTGALCIAIALAHRPPRWLIAAALVLHTWSWAMSMLDSYQHHYLLSLVLLAFAFFPPIDAERALLGSSADGEREPEPAAEEAPKDNRKKRGRRSTKSASKSAEKRARRAAEPTAGPRMSLLAPAPLIRAWGFVLLTGSIAIVYAYTAYSKSDPEWLSGAALRNTVHLGIDAPPDGVPDPIGPFRALLAMFGIEGERLWYAMGHGVVVVQIICAAGYLLVPIRDRMRNRWLDAFMVVALLTALSFHLGAEHMELKVGWFSWYMVFYAFVFFLPARWLAIALRCVLPLRGARDGTASYGTEALLAWGLMALVAILAGLRLDLWPLTALGAAIALARPLRWLLRERYLGSADASRSAELGFDIAGVAAGLAGAIAVIEAADLPGATIAFVILMGALSLAGASRLLPRRDGARPPRVGVYGWSLALGCVALLASLAWSDVRWDYYRNVGGDHRRRGEIEEAYVAYVLANRYAPEGEDRRRQEQEARAALEAAGLPVPEVP
ncbi:MAG: hypothetical protein AB7S26_42660 [Sandaracinaceae bacterium]